MRAVLRSPIAWISIGLVNGESWKNSPYEPESIKLLLYVVPLKSVLNSPY